MIRSETIDVEAPAPLARELARARELLERLRPAGPVRVARHAASESELPALTEVARVFRLSAFERDVLLLALACEVDDDCSRIVGELRGRGDAARMTVGLVLRALAGPIAGARDAALAALLPDAHLARLGLLELDGAGPHVAREVRVPAAVWPRLAGLSESEPFPILTVPGGLGALVLADATRAAAGAALAAARHRAGADLAIGVRGRAGSGRQALAIAVAHELGFPAFLVDPRTLGDDAAVRAVVREAGWRAAAVILDSAPPSGLAGRLLPDLSTPLLVVLDEHDSAAEVLAGRPAYSQIDVAELDAPARMALWHRRLTRVPGGDALDLVGLASRHHLGAGRIATICRIVEESRAPDAPITEDDVAAARRRVTVVAESSLARRLERPFGWDDIVVTPATQRELRIVRAWARHAATLPRASAPSGMVCLFSGPPGTGKTMAAQVLARDVGLDLLRIDLSQVVNKYVGETEKNLDRVFSIAEETGAVLFFDEADALFARRTDVKDSHDRYANLETAFLLQRLETHRGLVILATNLRKNFDEAFMRRIQVIAEFPVPDVPERRLIWEQHLRLAGGAGSVDLDLFARRFVVAGGDIRNAVVAGVLLAADEGAPLESRHLAIGMWRELSKSGRILAPEDFGPMRDAIRVYLEAR